jgi:hypothetical protein
MMKSEAFKEQSKQSETDFTRERKVGFLSLVCIIINKVCKSTQLELDLFRERFMPESAKSTSYTKQSFSEAREKLNPTAFIRLNDELIRGFYADNDFKTYKGYRLLAVDASVLEIPDNPKTQKQYGFSSNFAKDSRQARALSSHLFDVENKLVLSSSIQSYTDSERTLAKENIDKMLAFGQDHIRDLILFDRAYPSADLISYLQSRDIKYVMRVSLAFWKEVISTTAPDAIVQVTITKKRYGKLLNHGTTNIPIGTVFEVRVLRVKLSSGETEILITNLSATELSYEESKPLYFKRWGIETEFDILKNKLEIENFSGERPLIIEQDFYATMLLCNMASLMEQEADEALQKQNKGKTLKYEVYKINTNLLVGKMKNKFIEILMLGDQEEKERMYQRFIRELQRNSVPVIKNRTFIREKKSKSNKYTKTTRCCL